MGLLKDVARALCARAGVRRLFVHDESAADYAARRFRTTKVRYLPGFVGLPRPSPGGCGPGPERSDRIGHCRIHFRKKGHLYRAGRARAPPGGSAQGGAENRRPLRSAGRGIAHRGGQPNLPSTLAKVSDVNEFVSTRPLISPSQSDALLLLYHRFIGSSGLMIRAALLGRPVSRRGTVS